MSIQVRSLSKCYSIDPSLLKYRTLREEIMMRIQAPFQRRTKKAPFWALSDINFDIELGEVVGIIGINGSGKSTLLKILSRVTLPSAGSVRLQGRVGALLEVGTGFHPELSGRENIFLSGAVLGMKSQEIRKRFDTIVEFADIESFLDTPVKRYSSGMFLRLAFSVMVHLDSEILIIDEVLSVGDVDFQKKCIEHMQFMARSGRTILFVSHHLDIVKSLCSRTLLLKQGRLIKDGNLDFFGSLSLQ